MNNKEKVRIKMLIDNKYPQLKPEQDKIIAIAEVIEKLKEDNKKGE